MTLFRIGGKIQGFIIKLKKRNWSWNIIPNKKYNCDIIVLGIIKFRISLSQIEIFKYIKTNFLSI